MYTKSILLASLAASAVSATVQLYPGHNQIKRDLAARQTENPSAAASAGQACLTDLASVYASLPTPPPVIESWAATAVVTDPCHFTLPASISSAEASYASEVEDWYSSNSAAIASALSECPAYSSLASQSGLANSFSDECATATGGSGTGGANTEATTTTENTKTTGGAETTKTTGGAGDTTTGTHTTSTGTTTAATTAATNAGPKETAAIGVAALAMAGVLAVAAL